MYTLSINILKAEYNEQALLKGLANNDSKSVDTLYKSHFPMVQHFVINNNGSFDDAMDVFQEAMITLYEKVQTDSFTLTCQIKTYLFSICKHLWLKRLQEMGRYNAPLSSEEESVSVEVDMEEFNKKDAAFAIMDRALNSLGEPCKSLLEGYCSTWCYTRSNSYRRCNCCRRCNSSCRSNRWSNGYTRCYCYCRSNCP